MKNKLLFFIGILVVYLMLNILFNFNIWKEVFSPKPANVLSYYGESYTYEVVAEIVRKNILSGKNPFNTYKNIFYPTGWNFVLDDIAPANGFSFLFFRPFLSMHQSLMLIVVVNIFLSNLCMYLLLRILKFNQMISFIGGLIYGFTPFVSFRLGHPNYSALFFFPLISMWIILLTNTKQVHHKRLYGFFLGLTGALLILTNLYYTVMVFIGIIIFSTLLFLFEKKIFDRYIVKSFNYFLLAVFACILFLVPWLIKVCDFLKTNSFNEITPLSNYIPYSADILNLIIPSKTNIFYKPILVFLTAHFPYIKHIYEDFAYPGILIWISFIVLILNWKKIPKLIKVVFFTSLFFLFLTFGPYLKIFGKTTNIPLFYWFMYKIPLIQMARSPGRFLIPFVFFSVIVAVYVFNWLLNKYKYHKIILILTILVIFIIDQNYFIVIDKEILLPNKIYSYLSKNHSGPVLDIPYSIRDGLRYLGYKHAVWHPYASFIHQQPIYGNYAGRINEDIFHYYENDPFFGFIDKMINVNSKNYSTLLSQIDVNELKKSADFFDIKNINLKTDEPYSQDISVLIQKLGFIKILTDDKYALYQRSQINDKEFVKVDLSAKKDQYYFFEGWYDAEPEGRWTHSNLSKIIFKINHPRQMRLNISCYSLKKPEKVLVYVNEKLIGSIAIQPDKIINQGLNMGTNLMNGYNMVVLKSSSSYRLNEVINNKKDLREVSLFVKNIEIKNK